MDIPKGSMRPIIRPIVALNAPWMPKGGFGTGGCRAIFQSHTSRHAPRAGIARSMKSWPRSTGAERVIPAGRKIDLLVGGWPAGILLALHAAATPICVLTGRHEDRPIPLTLWRMERGFVASASALAQQPLASSSRYEQRTWAIPQVRPRPQRHRSRERPPWREPRDGPTAMFFRRREQGLWLPWQQCS
jgi:hypothetical protein